MRVISGRFKGVVLPSPKVGTRPTTDRTKEAIFSYLDARGMLEGVRVLDLYSGTGALGIEALSRGATELVCVDYSSAAVMLLNNTLSELRLHHSWQSDMSAWAFKRKAEQFVSGYEGSAFDVVFIDPPYAMQTQECNRLLEGMVNCGIVDHFSVIVVERSTRSEDPQMPQGWMPVQKKHYGETSVFYFEAE